MNKMPSSSFILLFNELLLLLLILYREQLLVSAFLGILVHHILKDLHEGVDIAIVLLDDLPHGVVVDLDTIQTLHTGDEVVDLGVINVEVTVGITADEDADDILKGIGPEVLRHLLQDLSVLLHLILKGRNVLPLGFRDGIEGLLRFFELAYSRGELLDALGQALVLHGETINLALERLMRLNKCADIGEAGLLIVRKRTYKACQDASNGDNRTALNDHGTEGKTDRNGGEDARELLQGSRLGHHLQG
mmetsp:Transcript_26144/g.75483  ORF Transcript_26144/g.75483 Transcript_26144/m.75483 type:complete len:248 (+) Transcript_26144:202-945(+)